MLALFLLQFIRKKSKIVGCFCKKTEIESNNFNDQLQKNPKNKIAFHLTPVKDWDGG